MDNNSGTLLGYILLILALSMVILIITEKGKKKKKRTKTQLVIIKLSFNSLTIQTNSIMSLTLDPKQTAKGLLGVVRRDIGASVDNLTLADITFTSSDTAVFGVIADTDLNTIDIQTVAPGSGVLAVSATCSYTDPDDSTKTRTESKSVSIPVTVSQVATQTDLVVTFGSPFPTPTV